MDSAIENDFVDLQLLLMFLVYEKKVLTMDDDTKKLDLFFLEKHNERMNFELIKFREKIKMPYQDYYFEIKVKSWTHYVRAKDKREAILKSGLTNADSIKLVNGNMLVEHHGVRKKLREIEGTRLGGYQHETVRT